MAKKLRVIGEGCEFYDDWRKGDGLICGVKISGTNVDVLDHLGNWLMIKGVGEPIDRLLWEKGGNVHALTASGRLLYCTNLSPNPKIGYNVHTITIEDPHREEKEEKKERKRESSRNDYDDDDSWGEKVLKWIITAPFRFIWWLIKGIWNGL